MTPLLWAAFTSVWLLCLYLLLCTVIKREGKVCDCKRRRTIWLTIDKTCAFGSQVMISSQGTKSSFHSQCKFETGMVKKRAATQSLKLSECPFFDMGFSRFMRLGSGLKRPLGSLGFLSMLSFFTSTISKGFFSDCLPFKKNLQFPFLRLFRGSAFHPFNKSVMSWNWETEK